MTQQSEPKKRRTKDGKSSTALYESPDLYGKVPPQAKDLEGAIIGAILLEREAIETVAEILQPESFYSPDCQIIFRAILTTKGKNIPVDSMTVIQQLRDEGTLDEVGGAYGVIKHTNAVVNATNVEAHAKIVQQKFMRRELIRITSEIRQDAFDETTDEFELLEDSEKKILSIGAANTKGKIMTMDDALVQAMHKIEAWRKMDTTLTGVPSGFPALDKATRGWQPGDFILLAARPSVGKTAFALNLIRNAALNKTKPTPVAVWSLEMSVVDLVLRMLAAESETMLYRIQTGKLSDDDMSTIYAQGVDRLSQAKIFFDDSETVTIAGLRAKARRLKKKYNIGLLVIDYLQLLSGDKGKGNREQEISYISREIKKLARELQIPIIALSQLSREVEKRTGAKAMPQLSDLRESGSLEQDADLVMFLWGAGEEELKENADATGKRYIRVAKNRNGVLITEEFDFKNEIQLFEAIDSITRPAKQETLWTGTSKLTKIAPAPSYYEPAEKDPLDDVPF